MVRSELCRVAVVAVFGSMLAVVPVAAQNTGLPYAEIVADAAARHGVDPLFVHAVIAVESGHSPDAVSSAGAEGLMQLMPRTARMLGVGDSFDPRENVEAGVTYLRRLADEFGTVLALAAYNAGPGAVREHGGVPPFAETRRYVRSVLLALIRLRSGFPPR
jgi:soluble lytic murein transglycosylase-like protein